MENFLTEFEKIFKDGFYKDLKSTLKKIQDEKVYTCAFGTDSDFGSLFLAINTEESLSRHISSMKKMDLCNSSEDEMYYRWGCSEYQYGDDKHFDYISKLLFSTDNVFDYRDEIVNIIAKTVMETKDEIFAQYGQTKEEITFFVSMTDDDMAEELENESVVKMTNSYLASIFLKRYDKQ